jgi:hypothetical protein
MNRPVWLFSMDTDQFCAPPMTTGALKAYFAARGRTSGSTDVELVHFPNREAVDRWVADVWSGPVRARANEAVGAGSRPVFAFSCYTWNVAEFLELMRLVKRDVPDALVIAGGPHVQRAEDFLTEGIDIVVLGEGEEAFTGLLDCGSRDEWHEVAGCAFAEADGRVHRTPPRGRETDLDRLPSALDVIPLRDAAGQPMYRQVAYETSRGCPYRCAFCEWGTGAIGTKMYQFSLSRIRADLECLVAGGVQDIWLCDSNFGALKEDVAKAEIFAELRQRTGMPQTFATSWSKNHNKRVQQIVRLLHRNGLLWHYHLALQTLTPRALELSHRTNMRANDYEPVVKALAAEGVPVAAELIWGLPGDTLPEFETNLNHLFSVFPNINIFAYTLLPGTEFFDRRDELQLVTLPVAGYGKAKGEYVVGCHTFSRDDGEEGYLLVSAHVMLSRGHVMPLAVRYLALDGRVSVSALLRGVLRAVIDEFGPELPEAPRRDRMAVYEDRAELYLHFLNQPERMFGTIRRTVLQTVRACGATDLVPVVARILEIDQAVCPRVGEPHTITVDFEFAATRVMEALTQMELPDRSDLVGAASEQLTIYHTARVGEVLLDPDGGTWMRGCVVSTSSDVSLVDDPRREAVERRLATSSAMPA